MIASSQIPPLIRSHFPLAPVPSLPEIVLHTARPKSGLWRLAELDRDFATPYWAFHWGGGLALARHVLNCPAIVAGRTVLDLGAGSGIVGIAAAKAGAKRVIAADIDRWAITAISVNAGANGVTISTVLGDLTTGSAPDVDIVLVGDLFYAQNLARKVAAFLDRCLASDIDILIGDPGRPSLPRDRLRPLAEYPGADFGNSLPGEPKQNTVFSFMASACAEHALC